MQKWKNRCCCCLLLPLLIVLIIFLFWGQRVTADYAYAGAYKDILTRYLTRMQELSARPSPAKEGSKKAQITALEQRAESTAKVNEEAAHRLKQLKPPADFQSLHQTTLALLMNTADNCHGISRTIRQSGLESLAGGYDQLDASQKEALGQLAAALQQIRPSTPGGKGILDQWQATTKETSGKDQERRK